MRELKFRIWDDFAKKMLYLTQENFDADLFWQANREGRLMLSTGLVDIEDKEIYDGDYVRVYDTYKETYYKGKIKYIESRLEFAIESSALSTHKRWINYDLLVIGNSFENPGLLVTKGNEV